MSAAGDLHAALEAYLREACERTATALNAEWTSQLDGARVRIAELELARDPEAMRREGLVKNLIASATRLVQIERDDARAQVARVRALHRVSGVAPNTCRDCTEEMPCSTLRALDGEAP